MGNRCRCRVCRIGRGIERLKKKYNLTKRDMASIEALWMDAEADSTELGMLKLHLKEGRIPNWVESPDLVSRTTMADKRRKRK